MFGNVFIWHSLSGLYRFYSYSNDHWVINWNFILLVNDNRKLNIFIGVEPGKHEFTFLAPELEATVT